jgi:hypothetical protein
VFGRPSIRELLHEHKGFFRTINDEHKDLLRTINDENKDLLRTINDENKDFLRTINDENKDFLRTINDENNSRWERALEETREFNREILLRNEKVYTRVIAEMEKHGRLVEENIAETRASTQAVLSVLDRLDEMGGASA